MLARSNRINRGSMAPVNFRQQIKERLIKLGLTTNQLADILKTRLKNEEGPSRNALYTYLRGESDMVSENLARILDVLDQEERKRR
jgi:transcriptional regulator with XRE-family HTH domain